MPECTTEVRLVLIVADKVHVLVPEVREPFCKEETVPCGYGCCGCGRCKGEFVSQIVPRGKCSACNTQNSPSATICKNCGAAIDNTKFTRVKPGTR